MARTRVWLRRYLPAEIAGTTGALLAAAIAGGLGGHAAAAVCGAAGEAAAFYAVILVRDLRATPAGRDLRGTARRLLVEFGPAEVLDTLLLRPLAMYVGTALVSRVALGIVLGKVAADVVFYALAIAGYELSSRERRAAPEGRQ
jgi:hypothetical protein